MTFQRYIYKSLNPHPRELTLPSISPQNYIASCGCTGKSTHYPTAALNQMAFGSSDNYGPGCGRCFKLTLLNSYTGTPPFFPDTHPSVVVKVTDLCPLSENGWCSGTENKTNPYVFVHCVAVVSLSLSFFRSLHPFGVVVTADVLTEG